ncbi:MAG: hypothetical protein J5666_06875 [Bacilli bacterium]|nr:hypothetical protein [Bacilli bacterium]
MKDWLMTKGRKILLFASVGLLTAGIATTTAITLAKFTAYSKTDQMSGYQGSVRGKKLSIFLNANVWRVDGAVFYMYAYDSTNADYKNIWIEPTLKDLNETVGGTPLRLEVFEFDVYSYDYFIFVRLDPDGDVPSWSAKWNQTADIAYKSTYYSGNNFKNYFCITNIDTSAYTTNTLELNSGKTGLQWA